MCEHDMNDGYHECPTCGGVGEIHLIRNGHLVSWSSSSFDKPHRFICPQCRGDKKVSWVDLIFIELHDCLAFEYMERSADTKMVKINEFERKL